MGILETISLSIGVLWMCFEIYKVWHIKEDV